jgi:ribosomal protein S25
LENLDDEARTVKATHRVIASPQIGQADKSLEVFHRLGAEVGRFQDVTHAEDRMMIEGGLSQKDLKNLRKAGIIL